jgi:hypothetical protein
MKSAICKADAFLHCVFFIQAVTEEEDDEEEDEEEDGARKRSSVPRTAASSSTTQRGLVVVNPGEEFSAVWGSTPFYAPETPSAAVEDLLLLHTRWDKLICWCSTYLSVRRTFFCSLLSSSLTPHTICTCHMQLDRSSRGCPGGSRGGSY